MFVASLLGRGQFCQGHGFLQWGLASKYWAVLEIYTLQFRAVQRKPAMSHNSSLVLLLGLL